MAFFVGWWNVRNTGQAHGTPPCATHLMPFAMSSASCITRSGKWGEPLQGTGGKSAKGGQRL